MNHMIRLFLAFCAIVSLSACTETQLAAHIAKKIPMPGDQPARTGSFKVGSSYVIKGVRYYPKETYDYTEVGMASWYGPNFHGKLTANGEIYDQYALTAAHRTLQMPSLVEVTNLSNGKSLILRVNDRGPFSHNRIIDVSQKAADLLGFRQQGVAKVRVTILPEESRKVAMMAKAGRSTSGTEVAMNRSGTLREFRQIKMASVTPSRKPAILRQNDSLAVAQSRMPQSSANSVVVNEPLPLFQESVEREPLQQASYTPPARKPIIKTVQMQPILETERYFIKAGTLSDVDSAETLRASLMSYGRSRIIPEDQGGTVVYHVKLGPIDNKAKADAILSQMHSIGRTNSTITVAKR